MTNFISTFLVLTALFGNDRQGNSLILIDAKQGQDTLRWIDNFKKFRNAVYQNDRVKVKQFIDFPILNENNEIWYLVYEGNGKALKSLSDKIKPFTEKDFDKYYEKLFPTKFITSILKVKSEELFKSGSFETQELKADSTTYKMYARFHKATNLLELNLAWNTPIKNRDGTVDPGEGNISYEFVVVKNGQIKFKQVRLAG